MGLVHDDQIVLRGAEELLLELVAPTEHVEADDHERVLFEGVAHRGLDVVAGEDGERESKLHAELVLPLLDEVAGRDDEATLQVAPNHEFLDEKAGHDRLSGAGVVCE